MEAYREIEAERKKDRRTERLRRKLKIMDSVEKLSNTFGKTLSIHFR